MRTIEEIISKPEIGDIVQGRLIRRHPKTRYIWMKCPSCGTLQWKMNNKRDRNRKQCRRCPYGADARSPESIMKNPMHGEIIRGRLLGYKGGMVYIWLPCPTCGTYRWIQNTKSAKSQKECRNCARTWVNRGKKPQVCLDKRKYHQNAEGKYRTLRFGEIPKEGDLIRGEDIGRNEFTIYRWTPCPKCGIYRWIAKNIKDNPRCPDCGREYKKGEYIGEKSSQWKGGRILSRKGYIRIRVRPDNPFYSMADHIGYIPEHRLVMAEYLGRPLKRWEIVHHKHDRFPAGTVEDKQDNRIENLELLPNKCSHDAITSLEKRIMDLTRQVESLKTRIKINEWRIKELETEKKPNT